MIFLRFIMNLLILIRDLCKLALLFFLLAITAGALWFFICFIWEFAKAAH